jgi:phage-related protein
MKKSPEQRGHRQWRAVFFTTESGHSPILEAIRALPKADRVEIGQTLRLVQEEGPDVGMPFTEQVSGDISAIRVRVRRTRWRIFFFAHVGEELVLLHIFAKKTRAMPRREIGIAERRRKDWLSRESR